jgi:hypothetical protein
MAARYSVAVRVCLLLGVSTLLSAATRPAAAGQIQPPDGTNGKSARRALVQARLAQTVAAADLNGDGLTDVAVADFLNDSITIRLAKASGGFEAGRSIPAGRGPRSIVAADFDHDGSIDLAVGAFLDGTLRVLRGRGTGNFEETSVQRLGVGLSSIAAGDFDGDGLVDLATANAFTGRIGLLTHAADAASVHSTVTRAESTTLLVVVDNGGGAGIELLAISADGETAQLIALGGQARQTSAAAPDLEALLARAGNAQRGHASSSEARLAKRAGDGQVTRAGSAASEPLILDIQDASGGPGAGAQVVFSRARGSAAIDDIGAADHTSTADLQGRVSVKVIASDLPDASVIAAIEGNHVEHFGVLSTLDNEDIGKLLAAAIARERRQPESRARLDLRLQHALERLQDEDALGAVRDLGAIVDESQQSSIDSADQISRRFIDQILVAGVSPASVDTDPLVCNVTLTRTIEVMTEVDAFTLTAAAGERVYVAFSSEGGIAGFNPVWRLLAPGGGAVPGCGTFTTVSLDCTLPNAGTYTLEVEDSGLNATGTYSIQIQRLRAAERCGGSISCDVAQSGTLAAGGRADTDLYSFTGIALENVHIALARTGGAAGFNPVWRLILPDGSPAPSCGTFSTADRVCALSIAGSYAIHVADSLFDASGTYGVHVQRLTAAQRCGGTIACNVTGSHTLGSVNLADTNLHSFDAAAGERIYVAITDLGAGTFNPVWRLVAPDGTLVPGCSGYTTASLDCSLPSAGSYAVEVVDSNLDGSGTYSLQIQRLTAANRCDAAAIACDTPVATTIGMSGEADTNLHSFTGVAGEIVGISLTSHGGAAGFAPLWRLLLPSGAPDPSCGTFSTAMRSCPLSVGGSYAIHVADNFHDSSGTYGLHLQRLTAAQRCGASLACNVTVTQTVALTNTADTNLHSFPGTAGERVYIVLTSEGGTLFNPVWRLVAPDGSLVTGCNGFSTSARDCTVPTTGSYAIEVADGNLDGSGTYGLHLQRLTAGQRCDGTTIGCDSPQTSTIGTGQADTNLHSFSSTAGEVVHINLASHGGAAGFFPVFRLLLPDGSPAPECGTFGGPRDCTLGLSGSYAIQVADNFHDSTGTYSVHVQRLTAAQRCGGSIACDTPSTTAVGSPALADSNLHSFSAVANERVYIAFRADTAPSFNPAWRLLSPAGTPVTGCGSFTTASQDCTLPAAGSYAIEVVDSNLDGSGSYHLDLQRLTEGQRCGTTLTCGAVLSSTVGTPIRADSNVHTFTGIAGQTVNVTVGNPAGAAFNPIYRLLLPDGSPTASCGAFAAAGTRNCALAVAGSYAVHVVDNALDGGGTYDTTVAGPGCTGTVADMVISALTVPKKTAAGASINVKPTTKNNGPGASGPTTTRIFLSNNNTLDAGDTPLGDIAVLGLAAGALKLDSQSVTIPAGTAPGKKFIIAQADATGAQTETSEANNTLAKPITIGPDLMISAFVAPATASPGNTISVTVTTKNNGGAPVTISTTTRLYFSNDAKVDAGDPFQALTIGPLAPGATQTHTVNVTIPAGTPLGGRYLLAVADALNQVAESSEKNTKKKAITIQ